MRRTPIVLVVAAALAVATGGTVVAIRAFSGETSGSGTSTIQGKAVAIHLRRPFPIPTLLLTIHAAPRSGDFVLLDQNNGLVMTAVSSTGSVRYLLRDVPSNSVDLARDGTHLAFMVGIPPSGCCAQNAGIYVEDLATGDQRYVTACPSMCRGSLDWSPDGARIAFSDNGGYSVADGHIYVVDADGSHLTRLPAGPYAYGPSWSPDGTRIAFLSGAASPVFGRELGPQQVNTIRLDGSAQTQIASCERGCRNTVAWSPDGTRIAYVDREGISVVAADGSGQARLTRGGIPPGVSTPLGWSPDSTQIAYGRTMLGYGAFVVNVDAAERTKLTWPCPCRRGWDPASLTDAYWLGWIP